LIFAYSFASVFSFYKATIKNMIEHRCNYVIEYFFEVQRSSKEKDEAKKTSL